MTKMTMEKVGKTRRDSPTKIIIDRVTTMLTMVMMIVNIIPEIKGREEVDTIEDRGTGIGMRIATIEGGPNLIRRSSRKGFLKLSIKMEGLLLICLVCGIGFRRWRSKNTLVMNTTLTLLNTAKIKEATSS